MQLHQEMVIIRQPSAEHCIMCVSCGFSFRELPQDVVGEPGSQQTHFDAFCSQNEELDRFVHRSTHIHRNATLEINVSH